ncbi:MAG: hypothetical protein ACOC4J_02805 [Bacteroidota bacterium]
MTNQSEENKKEQLFDELIAVKLLHKRKHKELKKINLETPEYQKLKEELEELKAKIKNIENAISDYGESFLDVYDEELIKPLSESDIISLRDEISEIKYSLEAMDN